MHLILYLVSCLLGREMNRFWLQVISQDKLITLDFVCRPEDETVLIVKVSVIFMKMVTIFIFLIL